MTKPATSYVMKKGISTAAIVSLRKGVLEERRVVVINKFFSVEGRINALLEILPSINVNEEELSGEMLKWYKQLRAEPTADTEQTQMDL